MSVHKSPKIYRLIVTCCLSLLSATIFIAAKTELFAWRKVNWQGTIENPEFIQQKKWVKSRSIIESNNKPAISAYGNTITENRRLKPLSIAFQTDLRTTSSTLTTPVKSEFARFYFKDNSSENIRYMDKAHGLFSNSITSIVEDENGYVWIGSEYKGLVKTNGYSSWQYKKENGLRSNTITRLFKDSRKTLWICWEQGLSFLKNGKIRHVENEKLKNVRITRIREDQHKNIWIATDGSGVFKLSGDKLEVYNKERGLSSDRIEDVSFVGLNTIYFASIYGGLNIVKNNKVKVIRENEKLLFEFAPTALHYSKDKLWIGSFAGSFFYLEKEKLYKVKFNQGYERCFQIEENEFGIWFADYSSGMSLLRKDGFIQRYNKEKGLVDRNAFSFTIDHNKNVWVADPFSGLSMITVSPFRERKEFGLNITSIKEDQQSTKWIAQSGGGVSRFENGILENINIKPGKNIYTNDYPWDILPNGDGTAWVGTHSVGIGRIDPPNYNFYLFQKGNITLDITEGLAGDLWFSTSSEGLRKWSNSDKSFRLYTVKDGLSSNNVKSSSFDHLNRLWICSDKGVDVFKEGKICTLNKSKGLSSNHINDVVVEQNGKVWISTDDAGLNIVTDNKIVTLDEASGLIDNRVLAVLNRSETEKWAITSSGLTLIKVTNNSKYSLQNFGIRYGSFMLDFTGAAIIEKDGRILFGTSKGYVEFDPYFFRTKRFEPKLQIESVVIGGKQYTNLDKVLKGKTNQSLEIEFSVMNWGASEQSKCAYAFLKKGSQDTNWIETKMNDVLRFEGFSSGNFQLLFEVRTKKRNKIIEGPFLRFQLPWYNTVWFYALIVLTLLFLINRFFKFRLKRLQKKKTELENVIEIRTKELEREKKELSKANKEIADVVKEKDVVIYEMHHRVKNNLQTISTLLDMQIRSLKNEDGIAALSDAVRRISAMSTSHELLYSSDELSQINFKTFLKHLIETQEKLLVDEVCRPEITCHISDFTINVTDCISIGMIVSEILSNSMKYAFKGIAHPRIEISANRVGDQCILSISDNGVGTTEAVWGGSSKGLGVRLIKIFTQKLQGELSVEYNQPGVKVVISFPCEDLDMKQLDV